MEHSKKESENLLRLTDFSVSGEHFFLRDNLRFKCLETHPKPLPEKLPAYYESDNYISHTNYKRNWFERTYQVVRNFGIQRKLNLINNFIEGTPKQKSILDVGAGTGHFLQAAQKKGWLSLGVEQNDKARTIANNLTKDAVLPESSFFKFTNAQFDVVTLWHVLEHVYDLDAYLNQFYKILKPGGLLVIAVPNYKSYDAKYYKAFWAAYDVPRHLWHFSKASIQEICKTYAFNLVTIKPLWFDAFYVSLLSEEYKTSKKNPIKAFAIGLWSNFYGLFTKEYSSHIYILKKR